MGLYSSNCRRTRPALARPLHQQLTTLRCLLLLLSGWSQHPLATGATLQGGSELALGQSGGELGRGRFSNAAVVEDLEIFTRVEEEDAGHPYTYRRDDSLPHGHQVRVGYGLSSFID